MAWWPLRVQQVWKKQTQHWRLGVQENQSDKHTLGQPRLEASVKTISYVLFNIVCTPKAATSASILLWMLKTSWLYASKGVLVSKQQEHVVMMNQASHSYSWVYATCFWRRSERCCDLSVQQSRFFYFDSAEVSKGNSSLWIKALDPFYTCSLFLTWWSQTAF